LVEEGVLNNKTMFPSIPKYIQKSKELSYMKNIDINHLSLNNIQKDGQAETKRKLVSAGWHYVDELPFCVPIATGMSQVDKYRLAPAPKHDETGVVERCRRWHLDLTNSAGLSEQTRPEPSESARVVLSENSAPPGYHQGYDVSPPGHVRRPTTARPVTTTRAVDAPEGAGAWDAATSPFRTVATTALMLYLSGDAVHIFSVATTLAALALHGGALLETPSRFRAMVKRAPGASAGRICLYALLHAGLCAVGVAAAVYKCGQLGLLPSGSDAWGEALVYLAAEKDEPVFGGLAFR
jgi:ER membrane protein complex subunit 4